VWRAAVLAGGALVLACAAGREEVVVVHFGDSTCITDYLPATQRVDAVLNARLAARYPGQRVVSHNAARSGEHVREFLDGGRYDAVRGRIDRIDVALVRYGQNDMKFYAPAEFKVHLEKLADRLRRDYPGVHVVLETNTYVDPEHGGSDAMNARYDRYWEIVRQVAREGDYPLVDVFARRRHEVAAGQWDLSRRNKRLALERYGRIVVDDAKDEEMRSVHGWLSDAHPNPNGVRITADEEFRVLTATWPDRLPRAAAR
jgi:lysophospholipase L1-like esterase